MLCKLSIGSTHIAGDFKVILVIKSMYKSVMKLLNLICRLTQSRLQPAAGETQSRLQSVVGEIQSMLQLAGETQSRLQSTAGKNQSRLQSVGETQSRLQLMFFNEV